MTEQEQTLRNFSASDDVLLSPAKMLPYSESWVAVYGGSVVAVSPDLESLVSKLQTDLAATAIRYIEKDGQAAF